MVFPDFLPLLRPLSYMSHEGKEWLSHGNHEYIVKYTNLTKYYRIIDSERYEDTPSTSRLWNQSSK